MAYPSLPIANFQQRINDGRTVDTAADGLSRIRKLHNDRVAEMTFDHLALLPADVATFASYYSTNSTLTFSFTSRADGNSYTVAFAAAPIYRPIYGGRVTISVRLTQAA
jgi:hypothetical protein